MAGWWIGVCGERERGGDDEVTHFIQTKCESGEIGRLSVEVRRVVTDPHYL